jgi:hypothetical protein
MQTSPFIGMWFIHLGKHTEPVYAAVSPYYCTNDKCCLCSSKSVLLYSTVTVSVNLSYYNFWYRFSLHNSAYKVRSCQVVILASTT